LKRGSVDSEAGSKAPFDAGHAEAAIVYNRGARGRFLLVGDHAGRDMPSRVGNLGLSEPDLSRHIAWDIGVAGLGLILAGRLRVPFVRQRWSRLVIDCNRDPARADSIVETSDGAPVPGNAALPADERARRIAEVFAPYHAAIAAELDARAAAGLPTLVVALHSFTPVMRAFRRPWRFGVLHLGGSPFSDAMLAALRADPEAGEVGDNEPYRMDDVDYTIPHHAMKRGLDYLELETRQDLIAHEKGEEAVADRLARLLPLALADLG
jgi:predicted N-formylglutamate amidohydrolase